jgi:tRNA A-37 threonylcarbamoyl transferase component Bud32
MSDSAAESGVRREGGRPLLKDRYLVDRELGRGGMSVVYLAYDQKLLNKPVIVKVLRSEQKDNEWLRKKLMQEMEALARIDHPGVVGVLDQGDLPAGGQYLVMQYVEGVTLRSAIPEGGMEIGRAAAILRQMGQALEAAHEKGVWHRDLKPENIMLQKLAGGGEQAKLIDFGIAGIQDSVFAGSKTNVAGSLSYMAPEQFVGNPGAASDIWAMAVVAFEMLTGTKPFSDASMAHLASADQCIPAEAAQRRPELPRAFDVVVRRGLAFAPEARYRSARAFAEDLAEALEGKGKTAAPVAVVAGGGERKPFPKWILAAAGAGVLALAGVGAWFASGPGKTEEKKAAAVAEGPKLELNYSLLVQRTRDGADVGEPVRVPGEMMVEHGYKIALEFESAEGGELYVFNEARDEATGGRTIVQLHPMAADVAKVSAGGTVRIPRENWFRFDGAAGTERLSVVWSRKPLTELEALAAKAARRGRTLVFGGAEELKHLSWFLENHRVPVEVKRNSEAKRTELSASGDLLIHRMELEHQ